MAGPGQECQALRSIAWVFEDQTEQEMCSTLQPQPEGSANSQS